ncbi:VIT domain-containing protein [Luteolibacter marinus]|uniref:VIT domain-containing protein n=1 Tax=Luteolibacter marinus TaxID=2776705 RepID=UPI001866145E|nr:VIT domain-containing protein [Luteolibacter marinus]
MSLKLHLLLWLALMPDLLAQGPRMAVKGENTQLEVEAAEVRIQLVDGVASTEMELTFRNDTRRMIEGEFTLPLPAGATVSSYALEVNGALREAVAVEKERARNAYESIKRRMVDPGIVEREEGNVYRTRVFPIPAKGTKRLRIGYVEELPRTEEGFRYRLPLAFEGKPKHFRCEIVGAGAVQPALSGSVPLTFQNGVAEAGSVELAGELELRLPAAGGPVMVVEDGDEPVFLLSDVFPPLAVEKRPPVRSVALFWDASESGAGVDHAATFQLLDAWFAKQGEVEVDLKLLRNEVEDGGLHQVAGGDWGAIRKILESVEYEGATSMGALESGTSGVVMYCGDGGGTLDSGTGSIQSPLLFLRSGVAEVSPALRKQVADSGGVEVAVERIPVEAAMKALETMPFNVVAVNGVVDFHVDRSELQPGKTVRIYGNGAKLTAGPVEISYGVGKEVRLRRDVHFSKGSGGGVIRRLWAQRKLVALERSAERSRGEIIAHCKEHGLVSGLTSLIVLEQFDDHLRYEIPPPEPELLARYQAALKDHKQRKITRAESDWEARLAWYRRAFPGYEHILVPRLRQVGIWKKSLEEVFRADELDPVAVAKVAGWHDQALALIERRRELADAPAYALWKQEVDRLHDEGPKLAATPVAGPPPGQPLVVSVRGLVRTPGQVRSEGPLTLREAIRRAGGTMLGTNLDHVALYRSAGKTVYNTLSKQYEDVALRPGDMVVVDEEPYSNCDPFSAMPAEDPRDREAVVSDDDVWVGLDPFAGDSEGEGSQEARAKAGAIRILDPAEAGMPDLAEFGERLKAGEHPWQLYRQLKDGRLRPQRFYIEAARQFFATGQDKLAMRVLSSLVERSDGRDSGRRAMAWWLIEFGKKEAAGRMLAGLVADEEACPVAYPRAELAASDREREILLAEALRAGGEQAEIVRTELNRLRDPESEGGLPCDLRIVVAGQFEDLVPAVEIIEPGGEPVSGWRVSPTGGRLTRTQGLADYMIRRAVPGTYLVRVSCPVESSFRIAMHRDWGRASQKTVRLTRLVEANQKETVAELEFEFAGASE